MNGRPYLAAISIPSTIESIRPATTFVLETARMLRVPAASDPLFETAIVEVLTNALKHGNAGEPGGRILCELELTETAITLRVFDPGAGFVLPLAPEPGLDPVRVEDLPEQGYGLQIMRAVFPTIHTISRDGRFGIELSLPLNSAGASTS